MVADFEIEVECPYCQCENDVYLGYIDEWGAGRYNIECANCGKSFRVKWCIKSDVDIFKMEGLKQ